MSTQKITILLLITFGLMGCCTKKTAFVDTESTISSVDTRKLLQEDFTKTAGSNKVYFAFDSFDLSEEAKETLKKQAKWLKSNTINMVMIEGHCDDIGKMAYNTDLGLKRAESVRSFLIKQGVDKEILSVISCGEENPEFSDHSKKSHRLNRKAVVVIIN